MAYLLQNTVNGRFDGVYLDLSFAKAELEKHREVDRNWILCDVIDAGEANFNWDRFEWNSDREDGE